MLFKGKLLYIIYFNNVNHYLLQGSLTVFGQKVTDQIITMSPATAVKVSPVQEQDRDKEAGQAARRPAKLQDLE